jgi:hypothetical protein
MLIFVQIKKRHRIGVCNLLNYGIFYSLFYLDVKAERIKTPPMAKIIPII